MNLEKMMNKERVPGPYSFVPGKDINAHYYFDLDLKVLLQTPEDWQKDQKDFSMYDALLRTSRALLAWGRPDMEEGMLSHFRRFEMIDRKGKYWYQGSRAPGRYQEDDVSRDQIIGFFYAMFLRGDKQKLFEIINHTPYKLSRRFSMTPDMWLWTRAIQGKKYAEILWHISSLLTLPFLLGWNKIVNLILGYKEIDQKDYIPLEIHAKHRNYNRIQSLLDKSFFPSYSINHICWCLECVPNSFLKRCVQKLILLQVEKGNYVERLLCGDKTVTESEVFTYKPMTHYRWSTKLDGNALDNIKIPEPWNKDLIEKLSINQLDRDTLLWLWSTRH